MTSIQMATDERRTPLFCNLSKTEQSRMYMAYAIWAAQDGLGQNAFETEGFKHLCDAVGMPDGPSAETIHKYQCILATEFIASVRSRFNAIAEFSPLPLISLQTDLWTGQDGAQQMGMRVTACDPHTLKMENVFLPLGIADGDSLDAEAEARLVADGLSRLSLTSGNIYSQTTTVSSSATLTGERHDNIRVVSNWMDQIDLVVKDCLNVDDKVDSSYVDLDDGAIRMADLNALDGHLLGVAARASHFNCNALAKYSLKSWQFENRIKPINFIPWCSSRWTSIFDSVLKDYRILDDANRFITDYVTNQKFTPAAEEKLRPGECVLFFGRSFVSILFPLYSLAHKLQEDDIPLAEAFAETFETWMKMKTSNVTLVDKNGNLSREKLDVDVLYARFIEFRTQLAASLKTRLLENVDDETLIGVALDPEVYSLFEVCGTSDDHFAPDVVEFAKGILERINRLMSGDITMRLFDIYSAKEKDTKRDQPATAGEITCEEPPSRVDEDGDVRAKVKRLRKSKEQVLGHTSLITLEVNGELLRFLEKRKTTDLSAMKFWEQNASMFPNLYHLFVANRSARPATAKLESCFCVEGARVPKHLGSYKKDTLNQAILLKNAKIGPIDIQQWAAKVS